MAVCNLQNLFISERSGSNARNTFFGSGSHTSDIPEPTNLSIRSVRSRSWRIDIRAEVEDSSEFLECPPSLEVLAEMCEPEPERGMVFLDSMMVAKEVEKKVGEKTAEPLKPWRGLTLNPKIYVSRT